MQAMRVFGDTLKAYEVIDPCSCSSVSGELWVRDRPRSWSWYRRRL